MKYFMVIKTKSGNPPFFQKQLLARTDTDAENEYFRELELAKELSVFINNDVEYTELAKEADGMIGLH